MKSKKWAMISGLVGFIGGGFSVLSPFLLTFAAIAKSDLIEHAVQYGLWILNPLVLIVAIKSALYYKDDERVSNKVSNLFVPGGCGAAYSGSADASSNSSRFGGHLRIRYKNN